MLTFAIITDPSVDELASSFDEAMDALNDMSEPLTQVVQIVGTEILVNFAAEGRPSWEPLKPSTVAFKAKKGYEPEVLQRTGELVATVAEDWEYSDEGDEAVAALPDVTGYAKFHVDPGPRTIMPLRDFTFLPDSVEDEAETIFYNWVLEKLTP